MARQLILSALLLIGTLSSSVEHTTFALWTTSVTSTANQFSAGTLHIADSLAAGTTLSMDHLIAGDNFDAQLNVDNSGSLPLTYALSTSVVDPNGLAATLQATVRLKTGNPCSMRDGSVLYSGVLSATALGDPAHGVQAGDRTLAASTSESLCFAITLPNSADSSLEAATAEATFLLSAEQQ
jgi:hypothetical protein